jgi:hypothetical protein
MDDKKQWKKKVDFPFVKVRESDDEEYVEVGPIKVHKRGEQERVSFFSEDEERPGVDSRIVSVAWALFLMLVGVVLTYENLLDVELEGYISGGTGVILVGMNVLRMVMKIRISTFFSVVGLALLLNGAGEMAGFAMPTLPLLLIIVGLWIIIEAVRR